MKLNVVLLSLSLIMSITSCVKEGPIGPEGPQGIQGAQGPQGIPGSANVKRYSYDIALSSFSKWSATNEYWAYKTIGTSIGSNDAVLTFVWESHAGSYEWMALPMLDYWNTGNCFNTFNYSIATGNRIQFSIRNSCGSAPYSNMSSGSLGFRVFVISGASGLQVLDGIDVNNYAAVCEAFGLEE